MQKNFLIRGSIKQVLTKYQILTILPQISHVHKNHIFFKYICNFLDQLLHPYKFYDRDRSGILFFIFASCEPLKRQNGDGRVSIKRSWLQIWTFLFKMWPNAKKMDFLHTMVINHTLGKYDKSGIFVCKKYLIAIVTGVMLFFHKKGQFHHFGIWILPQSWPAT